MFTVSKLQLRSRLNVTDPGTKPTVSMLYFQKNKAMPKVNIRMLMFSQKMMLDDIPVNKPTDSSSLL